MAEEQAWIVTSRVQRYLRRNPEKTLDWGTDVYTLVYAPDEELAKELAEMTVRRDFFVDEYRYVGIEKYDAWVPPHTGDAAPVVP